MFSHTWSAAKATTYVRQSRHLEIAL